MSEQRFFPAKVRDLLREPGQWTQNSSARDAAGQPCNGTDPLAVAWCLMEAIDCCYPEDAQGEIYNKLYDAIDGQSLLRWNDMLERTFADMRTLVERLDI